MTHPSVSPQNQGAFNTESDQVLILLATYNGAKFLPEQLSSISRQNYTNWCLIASDDGSTDNTRLELARFQGEHPDRIQILDLPPSGSAQANFFRLLRAAPPTRFVAFCDQDDIWVEQKLEELVTACKQLEDQFGTDRPCLVYSDLAVVNTELHEIAPSFADQISSNPAKVTFGSTLLENSIPGCAMLVNNALVREFDEYHGDLSDARMHDWWLALLALSKGSVGFVPSRLVLYRQHESNSAGSVRRGGVRFALSKVRQPRSNEARANVRQAELFLNAYGQGLPAKPRAQLEAMRQFESMNKFSRVITCLRLGILKQTFSRRVFQLIRI